MCFRHRTLQPGTFKGSQARTGGDVQLCAVLCGSLVTAFVFIFAWVCSPQQASLQIGHQFSDRQNIFLMHYWLWRSACTRRHMYFHPDLGGKLFSNDSIVASYFHGPLPTGFW